MMNRKYKKYLILLSIPIVLFAKVKVEAALVARWKLDETNGTTVTDSSGNGSNGRLQGSLSFDKNSVAGIVGRAIHLDGKRDHGIHIDSISLPTDAFTIALWFSPDFDLGSESNRVYLMFWGGPETPQGDKPLFAINKSGNGDVSIYVMPEGGEQQYFESTTTSWKAFTWYHLAATFDGTNVKLYVNGHLEGTMRCSGTHYASSKAYFGTRRDGRYGLEGKIDDIRIYDHALSAGEITQVRWPDEWPDEPVFQELIEAVRAAETIIDDDPDKAIVSIEKKMTELKRWKEQNPIKHAVRCKELSFDLHFTLAQAMTAARRPEKDINAKVSLALEQGTPSLSNCPSALLWLLENERAREFAVVVQTLDDNNRDYLENAVHSIHQHCESKKDWARFERFLNALFSGTSSPHVWTRFVESCAGRNTSGWAAEYARYLDSKPELRFSKDLATAEQHLADGRFAKAAPLYRELADRCRIDDDKSKFQFLTYKCMFLAGQYSAVLPELEGYIASNKATNRNEVREAMLLKARSCVNVGQLSEVVDSCFTLMIEYPETTNLPEVNFLIGYSYMLQGAFKPAIVAFDCLIKDYPKGPYASKAQMYIARMESMKE
ncbi:MAG: LamG-like jellyroll fold domain-containing protein [Planctomycetota bacterium]|jgi:hypothetical protein